MSSLKSNLVCALSAVILSACSGVTPTGPVAFLGDQSAKKIVSRSYYPSGAPKSEVIVEGYSTTNPNPQLTAAAQSVTNTYTMTRGAIDLADITVTNPNKIPKDPNKIPKNPNVIPKDPNVIPKDPNIIHP